MEDNSSNKNTVELFEEEKEKETETEEDLEMLKRSICSHPLYRLLIETHLDCLKMSLLDDMEEADENVVNEGHKKVDDTITSVAELPDLDHFMEAYCRVLGEFKEAMKKPLYGTTAFINDMHSQLKELTSIYPSYTMTPTSPGLEED